LFDNNKTGKAQQSDQERKLNELYAEVGRPLPLSTQIAWLKKIWHRRCREPRMALIEREHPSSPVTEQAELLGLNRTSFYYQPILPS